MYTNDPTNSSPGPDEAPAPAPVPRFEIPILPQRAIWYGRALYEALARFHGNPVVRAAACALLLGLTGCGGGSAEAPPVNAVGIGGSVYTRDSSGRPLAVDLTVVVTGQGVKPVGGR